MITVTDEFKLLDQACTIPVYEVGEPGEHNRVGRIGRLLAGGDVVWVGVGVDGATLPCHTPQEAREAVRRQHYQALRKGELA